MNCENICVCSSCEYSLWLERSRDLRKPEGMRMGRGRGEITGFLPRHTPREPLSWSPAQRSSHLFGPSDTTPHSKQTGSAPQHHGPFCLSVLPPSLWGFPKAVSLKRDLPMGAAHPKPKAPEDRATAGSPLCSYSLQAQKSVQLKAGAHKDVC